MAPFTQKASGLLSAVYVRRASPVSVGGFVQCGTHPRGPRPPRAETALPADTPPPPSLAVLAIEVAPPAALAGLPFVCVTPARFADLGPALLARLRPDEVLCPLFAPGFDAAAVIERLAALGFRGRVLVLAAGLPAPAAVAEELGAIAPAIAVAVLPG